MSATTTRRGGRERGFTLLEIMVVCAIIAVLAAFAIPNMLEARRQAQKIKAIAVVKQIFGAQQRYREKQGKYAANIAVLVNAGLLTDPFDRNNTEIQPNGWYEFQTGVPTGSTAVPPIASSSANSAVRFRVGCQPIGTSTNDRLLRGEQMYFMVENGKIFEHRPPACSLDHVQATISDESDTQFGSYYPPIGDQ